jgi:hypothetical protein
MEGTVKHINPGYFYAIFKECFESNSYERECKIATCYFDPNGDKVWKTIKSDTPLHTLYERKPTTIDITLIYPR